MKTPKVGYPALGVFYYIYVWNIVKLSNFVAESIAAIPSDERQYSVL